MMTFLSNLKLNAQDYAITAVVALIGGLVAALKLQGFQLHRAQVQLLKGQIEAKEARNADISQKAYDTYKDALNSFIKAGGTLLVLMSLWLPLPTHAAVVGYSCTLLPACINALNDCDKLQQAQHAQIAELLQDQAKLESKVVSEENGQPKAALAAGGVVGVIGGACLWSVKGALIGGPVGAMIGLGVGLLLGGF